MDTYGYLGYDFFEPVSGSQGAVANFYNSTILYIKYIRATALGDDI